MTERHYLFLLALMLLSLGLLIAPAPAAAPDDYWSPWVTMTSTDSATINWRGEENGSGSIDYATTSYFDEHQSYEKAVEATDLATYQHVRLSGLEPNTSYTYRVTPSGGAEPFANRTFRTMPDSGPFTFIVFSDPQKGSEYEEKQRFKYVADAIEKEPDILFILIGGDYNGHDSDGLWSQFFQVADGMLAKDAIFPTIGNHEYHNSSGGDNPPTEANHFHWSFDIPLNYSFDCSGVRFIVLNTPDPNNANGDDPHTSLALAKSQESWLKGHLGNDTLMGVFTIHHHPIWDYYNSTSNPDLDPWESLYHAYNISANFAGHTHNYQRYSIKGIPYFIVGNAGGRCADLTGDSAPAGYIFGMNKTLGYLKVAVDPAKNTATAEEWIVATVKEDDSKEKPDVFKAPKMIDSITFSLKKQSTV
ncbi:MAG TPA: fibronectin type III domain-containing protein [Methanothrix sp.]|nr:fibronectin type III domain-containing protein [Methanothrix sp.]